MTPSHFRNGVQYAFDSSTLKEVQACARKYKYRYIDGWRHKRKSVHLLFGGWYAKALETYYKLVARGVTSDDAICDIVLQCMRDTWEHRLDENGAPIADSGAPWMSPHPAKTRENLIRSIVWYLEEFGPNDNAKTVILSDGKPAVEYSFQLEVDNGIVLAGHIDRLVEYGGAVMVTDQKTSGSTIGSYFFDQFSPETQMSMYTFAGKIIYSMPIQGVLIDAAQIAVGFTRFERGMTYRTDSQLDEWYEGILQDIAVVQNYTRRAVENASIIEGKMVLDDRYFPMNPSSCDKYGGCEFRGICSKAPEVRAMWLAGEFEKQPLWNPLEKR